MSSKKYEISFWNVVDWKNKTAQNRNTQVKYEYLRTVQYFKSFNPLQSNFVPTSLKSTQAVVQNIGFIMKHGAFFHRHLYRSIYQICL